MDGASSDEEMAETLKVMSGEGDDACEPSPQPMGSKDSAAEEIEDGEVKESSKVKESEKESTDKEVLENPKVSHLKLVAFVLILSP